MAPTPSVVPQKQPQLEFWERFRRDAELRVRECNAIAGEPLWIAVTSTEPDLRLTIQSANNSSDRIDCAFDPRKALLTCVPGPDLPIHALRFRWVAGTVDRLRRGEEELTLCAVVSLLLDKLVWPDEA